MLLQLPAISLSPQHQQLQLQLQKKSKRNERITKAKATKFTSPSSGICALEVDLDRKNADNGYPAHVGAVFKPYLKKKKKERAVIVASPLLFCSCN